MEQSCIAGVYYALGNALMRNGKLNDAASKHEQSLEIVLLIHGHDKPHPVIVASLRNLGCVHEEQGKLEKALEKYENCLEMELEIYGFNETRPAIATSLNNLRNV